MGKCRIFKERKLQYIKHPGNIYMNDSGIDNGYKFKYTVLVIDPA
jgi:hypothetical protein